MPSMGTMTIRFDADAHELLEKLAGKMDRLIELLEGGQVVTRGDLRRAALHPGECGEVLATAEGADG